MQKIRTSPDAAIPVAGWNPGRAGPSRANVAVGRLERRNFAIYAVEGGLYAIAANFISYESVLPVFLHRLGATGTVISVIPVAIAIGVNLPGILFARRVQLLARVKPFVVLVGLGQRLPWLAVGIVTPLIATRDPGLLVAILIAALFAVTLSSGVMMPGFHDLIASTVPPTRRGMLTAFRSGISYLIGIGGGFAVRRILAEVAYPHNYAMLFLIASAVFAANLLLFTAIREPERRVDPASVPRVKVLSQFVSVLSRDPGFCWFSVARALLVISHATSAFFPIYIIAQRGLDDSVSGVFVVIASLAYVVVSPVLGRLGDRRGYQRVLALGAIALVAAALVGLVAAETGALFGLIAVAATARTVNMMAINMAIDYAGPGEVPVYVGVSGVVVGVLSPLGLLAGVLVERFGYGALFLMTGTTAVVALGIILFGVEEPRGRPIRIGRLTFGSRRST